MSRFDAILNSSGANSSKSGGQAAPLTDPRPELSEDAALWDKLLLLSAASSQGLKDALVAMRQGGARLRKLDDGSYALRASLGGDGDAGLWGNVAVYKAEAGRLLGPHKAGLVELLRKLGAGLATEIVTDKQMELAKAALVDRKFCAIKSGVLGGEVVYLAKTWEDGISHVPRGGVFYILEEIENLKVCPPTPDELRQIHKVKKVFAHAYVQRCKDIEQTEKEGVAS